MKFKKFVKAADGHIAGGGGSYGWGCYPSGQYMDVSDIDGTVVGSCVFNSKTNLVYEVSLEVADDNVAFRWIDPEWVDAHRDEASTRNVDPDIAWDDVYYTAIDEEEDILHLMRKIIHKTYVHSHSVCSDQCGGCACEPSSSNVAPEQCFTVKLTVKQVVDVTATSMEEAIIKAKNFVSSMSPSTNYSPDVTWVDNFYSSESVERQLLDGNE